MRDNYIVVQEHLEQKKKIAVPEAERRIQKYLGTLRLDEQTDEDLLLTISRQLEICQQEIGGLECPEYVSLAHMEKNIHFVFYSRLLLFDKNESVLFEKAIQLRHKYSQLLEQLELVKQKFSGFTFSDFLAGKPNAVFYSLCQCPPGTSPEAYAQMDAWQCDHLLRLVQSEVLRLIATFRNSIGGNVSSAMIDQEIYWLEHILKTTSPGFLEIKLILSQLIAMQGSEMPTDGAGFISSLRRFQSGEADRSLITPQNISRHERGEISISGSLFPAFIYSLAIYLEWLCKVKNHNPHVHCDPDFTFSNLFEETCDAALQKSRREIGDFRAVCSRNDLTIRKYNHRILERFGYLRPVLQELEHDRYYRLLSGNACPRSIFMLNCLLGKDPGEEARKLSQAIHTSEVVRFLNQEPAVTGKDDSPQSFVDRKLQKQHQLTNLILRMVPSPEILIRLAALLNRTNSRMAGSRTPAVFILEDMKEEQTEIFHSNYKEFTKILDSPDKSNVVEFLVTALKEIKRLGMEYKLLNYRCCRLHKLFVKFLKSEIVCNKKLVKGKRADLSEVLSGKETPGFSFRLRRGNEKELARILTNLQNAGIDFLIRGTTVGDLMKVFTAKNLEDVNTLIHTGCTIPQFRYILDKLGYLFGNMQYATLEKSGLFRNTKGRLITANYLSRSKDMKVGKKEVIDGSW